MSIDITTPLARISGIPSIHQKRLEKLELVTLQDLLLHFPRRYEDYSRVIPIESLQADEPVTVHGVIRTISMRRRWKGKGFITQAVIEDGTGSVSVLWFNQPFLARSLKAGTRIALAGKPVANKKGIVSFVSPEFEVFRSELLHTSRLVAVYPETRGITSKWLRWKIHSFLPEAIGSFHEELPDELVKRHGFMNLEQALWAAHFPKTLDEAQQARFRFSFTELLKVRLAVLLERESRKKQKALSIPFDESFIKELVASFGFTLTEDQRKATWDIIKDMANPYPMQRLLEGDVGTGKTLVALIIASLAARHEKQTAIMAPTEILASQHFDTFVNSLSRFGIPIGVLTRSMAKFYDPLVEHVRELTQNQIKQKVAKGEISIIIGTHALLNQRLINKKQKDRNKLQFLNLALVIIDEQHRFGVAQRSQLIGLKPKPHFLSMSATPIPRSLALTIYGNLSMSLLKTFPQGKRNIVTRLVTPLKRDSAYEFIRAKLKQNQQAYVICPIIEESEKLDTKAALEEYKTLKDDIFPHNTVGLLHGRMKPKEKEEVMKQFFSKDIHILVATSVVEVGVDVPGASVMIIEGAERFGLSQIHQLRGRIGRRGQAGYCLLFTNSHSPATALRLKALSQSNDGFHLAQKDLEIRGPGHLLGTHQSGMSDMAMHSLGDSKLVNIIKEEAERILPLLPQYSQLHKEVLRYYGKIHME